MLAENGVAPVAGNRLIIVDDEATQMQALCDTLRDHGYDPAGYTSASTALAALRTSKFDLLLTDLNMPEMDGIDLILESLSIDPNLVGIVMTGDGTIATAVEAMRAGALDYILKPFKMSVVLPIINRALVVRAMRLDNARLNLMVARHARELEAVNLELEAANRELEAFDYSVAHDLRAPIRHIEGFTSMLLEDYGESLDARGRECLVKVQDAGKRMDLLVSDLLALSLVSRCKLNRSDVDLSALAQNVFANLREAEPQRDVECVIMPDISVNADVGLLRIVLENLIGNAWKFTGKQLGAKVEFGCARQENEPCYFVRDSGAGFDQTYADRLFAPFQRLHAQSEFKGTGIGLATVRRVITRHGGKVWAEGIVNHGATFYFSLPS